MKDAKLEITFPTSSEDHRLQLVGINGSVFAFLHTPLKSMGDINLFCEEWSLVLLAPITSKKDVEISAINVICLNDIESEEGTVKIHASNRLVKLASIKKDVEETSGHGKYQFDDDPSMYFTFFQLFNKIIVGAREEDPNIALEAQQKFISSLCLLAQKIEGETADLNIQRVLRVWDIPELAEEESDA